MRNRRERDHDQDGGSVMERPVAALLYHREKDPWIVRAIVSRGEILGSCAIEQDNGDNLRRGPAHKIAHPRAP